MDELETLPIVTMKGLEGNEAFKFDSLQSFLYPYLSYIIVFWWALWIITLTFVVVRFLVLPALSSRKELSLDTGAEEQVA
ncbi:hypothetical protein HFO10_35215 [Rhizobium laguerreae]|uniref:hypothetical protein n=1 Tax=Rhizobium laguerreae TaxID=1076926 RepID=UPI001C901D88|nr:hypothetical protein [Rhizobium laguerreae]MBY3301074.1 hypothetical protein [Rhizobium laguerreae]